MARLYKLLISVFLLFINNSIYAKTDIYSTDFTNQYQNYTIQKQRFNAINYNALQLTPGQIDKYEDITECNANSYKEKLSEIIQETKKYQTMRKNNCSFKEIINQRKYIKNLYKDLSKLSHQENRELKKIFNREQRRNYNMIKHLERHDLKKDLHPKDYYKLNPKMSKFGNIDR